MQKKPLFLRSTRRTLRSKLGLTRPEYTQMKLIPNLAAACLMTNTHFYSKCQAVSPNVQVFMPAQLPHAAKNNLHRCMYEYMHAYLCGYVVCMHVHACVCVNLCIYEVCWLRALLWSSAVRCWHGHNVLIRRYYIACHILSIVKQCVTVALSRHAAGVEQSRGYDLAHRLCWLLLGPWAVSVTRHTALYKCAYVCAAEKEIQWMRGSVQASVCVSLCPKHSGIWLTGELSQEGRQPRQLALLPLAHKLGDGGVCRPSHVFSVTEFIHFPVRLIYTAWGLEDQDSKGSILMFWQTFQPSPTLRLLTTHRRLVAKCKRKLKDSWCLQYYSLFSPYFSSVSPTHWLNLLSFSFFHSPTGAKKWTAWGRSVAGIKSKCPDSDFSNIFLLWITLHVGIINDISLIKQPCAADVTVYDCCWMNQLLGSWNATARQLQKIVAFWSGIKGR